MVTEITTLIFIEIEDIIWESYASINNKLLPEIALKQECDCYFNLPVKSLVNIFYLLIYANLYYNDFISHFASEAFATVRPPIYSRLTLAYRRAPVSTCQNSLQTTAQFIGDILGTLHPSSTPRKHRFSAK